MRKALFLLGILLPIFASAQATFGQQAPTEGQLLAATKKGKELGACPLKTTAVKTEISGFLARVRVRQEFENAYTEPIEAIYTFPLSQNGAVDDMTMLIGERTVKGKIMKRAEAREVYEAAKSSGQTASLLDQERPNIFTQSVANIMPGDRIVIEISYVETLKYEDGAYEFFFPMTVGPRYIPGTVADASKISPTAADRPGHDISIEVNLNAGVPVEDVRSTSHEIEQIRTDAARARVTLKSGTTIPNKDFVLRYDVTGKKISDAVLVHRDERGGFFTLILQPPDKFVTEDRTPKEIVFVLDTSGSMGGFPIEKAKEAMRLSLDGLYPDDTFNLITFAGDTSILFDGPVPATQANLERAQEFLAGRSGGGGTEMMKAVRAALDPSDAKDHLRIVCFMTDGYVGNEEEIIAEVQKHANARVFSFGIGSSVNRHLLDKIAEAGRGEAEYVALTDDGSKAARKFYERVRTPLLTDLSFDWNGMPIADVYPSRVPDLFSAKPVVLHGRYTKAMSGTIRLKGFVAGQPYEREIAVNLPEAEAANDALASLWARTRVDDLSMAKLLPANTPKAAEFDRQIERLGLDYRILTAFTSFVAVEDQIVNQNGKPVTLQVPVARPEGVTDQDSPFRRLEIIANLQRPPSTGGGGTVTTRNVANLALMSPGVLASKANANAKPARATGTGVGYGSGSGSGSGVGNGSGNGPAPTSASTVGGVSEVVTVTGGSSTIQTSSTSVGTTVSADMLSMIPGTTASGRSTGRKHEGHRSGNEKEESKAVENKPSPPTPEMLREQMLKQRMHAWVYALMKRSDVGGKPADNEAYFVKDGKAELRVTLKSRLAELLEKLKALGFEISTDAKGNIVTGRIAIEKLAALAEMEEVVLVLPRV